VSSGALRSASDDGKFLMRQLLVEGGVVDGMTAGQYGDNNAMTLASALRNACNTSNKNCPGSWDG
jgi:hypothetical protein